MAYCGKCGQKNPDDASFCSACGARLQVSESTPPRQDERHSYTEERRSTDDGSQDRWRRSTDDGSQDRWRSRANERRNADDGSQDRWRSRANERRSAKEPDNAPDTNQDKGDKGGKKGGCLKRGLLWMAGLLVAGLAIAWGVSQCSSGSGGDGKKEGNDDMTNIEQVLSKSALDELMEKKRSFKKDNGDVVPRPGRYEGRGADQPITFDVMPRPNGKILGKVHVEMDGEAIRDCSYAYCGNGIYALYFGESIYDDPYEYFQALPDHETIEYKNGSIDITVTYKGPLEGQDGSDGSDGSGGSGDASVSSSSTKCMDEERLASVINQEGFPETDENHVFEYGTYRFKASMGDETHTMGIRLEQYDGNNELIVAKMSMEADGKDTYRGFVGYCGSSIYAIYMKDVDTAPYEDSDIRMNKPTSDFFYANSDGSISMYVDGKEKVRLRQDEMVTVDMN